MKRVSISELAILTGKTRETLAKALVNVPFEGGKKGAKLFDSTKVLPMLYGCAGVDGGEVVDNQEATRLLTIARRQQIDLEMEVTRKERIPKADVAEVFESTFNDINGILRANLGKTLSIEVLNDIFAQVRAIE